MKTHYDPDKYVLLKKGEPGDEQFAHPDAVVARQCPIHVPIAVVLGHFEKLTPQELNSLRADINAGYERREHTA